MSDLYPVYDDNNMLIGFAGKVGTSWAVFGLDKKPLPNPWPAIVDTLANAIDTLDYYHVYMNAEYERKVA